jgi:F-type H+-transporting ATPase subunit epsilon
MAAKLFQVDVVTPEAIIWSGEADFLVAKTVEGEIGVLADHEPTMAALATGAVEVNAADGSRVTVGTHGGFLQIFRNQVTLLTDRAELSTGDRAETLRLAEALAATAEDEE